MTLPQVAPSDVLSRGYPLPQQQDSDVDGPSTTSQSPVNDPRNLVNLPRELRDEIFLLAMQDDMCSARDAKLVSPPGPTIKTLTQVSRSVRVEAAGIYWSQKKFHFDTFDLRTITSFGGCGARCKFKIWLGTWGRLAVQYVRQLKFTLHYNQGTVDVRLGVHTKPIVDAWTSKYFGAEQSLEAFLMAMLFPDDYLKMTPEILATLCEVLGKTGQLISHADLRTDHDDKIEQKEEGVAELLSIDR
jgi:hypothetical protein